MPCNEEHARTLSRQYVCSQHFSETDFTVGDKTRPERSAVPNPFTVASHSNSAQHRGGPFSNSSSFEEYLHVLVPTKTHSKKVTQDTIQIHSDTTLPSFISPDMSVQEWVGIHHEDGTFQPSRSRTCEHSASGGTDFGKTSRHNS